MNSNNTELDLIWGTKAIASEINLTERQTFYMLETGKLPARKIGRKWVANRKVLHALFDEEGAA